MDVPYKLYNKNCLEVMRSMPDGSVDAVITDPPYGIGRDGAKRTTSKHGGRKAHEFRGWDASRPDKEIFDEIIRISKYQIIWGGNYFADLLPPSQKWLVWDKGQRIMQSDGELAWTSMSGALRIYELNRAALQVDGAVHPTQKPVSLMMWCIEQIKDSRIIFDPFMGSGSLGVAALKLGREFIGCEIDPKYFAIAEKRIKQAAQQPALLHEAQQSVQRTGGESGQQNLFSAGEVLPAKVTAKSPRR